MKNNLWTKCLRLKERKKILVLITHDKNIFNINDKKKYVKREKKIIFMTKKKKKKKINYNI